MANPAKPLILTLVSAVVFAFGATPAIAAVEGPQFTGAATVASATPAQELSTLNEVIDERALEALTTMSDLARTPANFDVEAAIALAESEIGTSRPTGWDQPGECVSSVHRWVEGAGNANWIPGGGNPVDNYQGATRLTIAEAQRGDIVQYEHMTYPTSWVTGVHTLLITDVNDDGTFTIIESNFEAPGLVTKNTSWLPEPPAGFRAVVWRF